jgi:5-methylthioadenosine/S-adenosylhomocysteine deaminase
MSLFRGLADDIPLQEWLEDRIWPLEGKYVSREFVRDGAMLTLAEIIRSGTTCFADNYFFPDEVAKAANEASLRAQLACPVLDFPTVWAQDADEYISKTTHLHDDYRSSELVSIAFGPHAPYTVSDKPLQRIAALAEELDVPIHIHMHENAREVSDALASDGRRPLARMADLGLVSPRLLCVHATQLIEEEMQLLSQQGASVIHCPSSNLKLASGLCEVDKLLNRA